MAQVDDMAAIRKVVEQFFAAYAKEDLEGLMSLWSERSSDLSAVKQNLTKTFNDHRNIEVKNLDISKVTIEAGEAKVRLNAEVTALDAKSGKPAEDFGRENRTLRLIKERGDWKVLQYAVSEEELAAAIMAAKTEDEKRALFDANKDLQTNALFNALNAQAQEKLRQQGKAPEALFAYRLALEVAERIDDKRSRAAASYTVATTHFALGNHTEALDFFQKTLALYEALGDKAKIPGLLNEIGQIYLARGNLDEAMANFQKSLSIAQEVGDKNKMAYALNSIGAVISTRGNYSEGIEYYKKALAIFEEIGEKRIIAGPLNNIGSSYRLMGDNVRALEYYQRSLEISEATNQKRRLASTLGQIGQIHYSQGNYSQALEYYAKALKLVEAEGYKWEVIYLNHYIGTALLAKGDYEQALAHYEKSLSLNEAIGQNTITAHTLLNIGNAYSLKGDQTRALDYFKRSLELSKKLGDSGAISNAELGLTTVYASQGNHAAAIEAAERALAIGSQMQKPDIVWMSHNFIGQSDRALGSLDLARQSFINAIEVIEKMRAGVVGGEQDKQRFFEDKLAPYHSMIELLLETKSFEDALSYAERAKARTLLDVLSSGRINVNKAMTLQEQEREQALHQELALLNSQVLQANQGSDLKARLEKARLEYENFEANLYAAHPELKVQRGESRPLTIEEAEKLLPDDKTALLEYVVGEKGSYLFVINRAAGESKRAAIKVYRLNLYGKGLADAAENFRRQIAERDLSVKESAQRLYDHLIKPAENQLRGVDKLIIVPDGALWNLPFQALNRGHDHYLLDDFTISYAPSLSVLREMRKKGAEFEMRRQRSLSAHKTNSDLLALGNPVLNFQPLAKDSVLRDDFGPLPSAEREVNTLRLLYGRNRSKVLIKDYATEEEVKAEAEKYRLLHFATHAVLDDRNPMYSRILLARGDDKKLEDGQLEAWELMKFDLKAEMIVLSACQTAGGRIGAGEGMIGMSWAVFVAGSPTVVVSQWKIDSDRTAELMIQFHENLLRRKRGNQPAMTKAEALRSAALKLRRSRYSHPFYWAAFVLIGNER
jgi:CHAT domain-containing protein/tetratricopeptide (TPR) repeat protein